MLISALNHLFDPLLEKGVKVYRTVGNASIYCTVQMSDVAVSFQVVRIEWPSPSKLLLAIESRLIKNV